MLSVKTFKKEDYDAIVLAHESYCCLAKLFAHQKEHLYAIGEEYVNR